MEPPTKPSSHKTSSRRRILAINDAEAILFIILAVIGDLAGFLGNALFVIPIAGQLAFVFGWLCEKVIWLLILGSLIIKRVRIRWFLGGGIAELFPFLNTLPFLTTAMIVTILEDRSPAKLDGAEAGEEKKEGSDDKQKKQEPNKST